MHQAVSMVQIRSDASYSQMLEEAPNSVCFQRLRSSTITEIDPQQRPGDSILKVYGD